MFLLSLLFTLYFVSSQLIILRRNFVIILPEYVFADPGSNITVKGKILNTGNTWLHDMKINISGLPFEYEIEPEILKDVRIMWNWSAMKRIPEEFLIRIYIPEDASGSYAVRVFAQEHFTGLKVWNQSYFILKITPRPNITITGIIFPTEVFENEPFEVRVDLTNYGTANVTANLTIQIPEDWDVDKRVKSVFLGPLGNASVIFNVTPTTTIGNFSVILTYPYKKKLITIEKAGPLLVPLPAPEKIKAPIINWRNIGIGVVVIAVLAFFLLRRYKIKVRVRKRPEKFKKKPKKSARTLETSSEKGKTPE